MRPHAIAFDLLVVLMSGLAIALVLGPFLNLLFGLPGAVEAETGKAWRFGLGTSAVGTILGPLLAGAVWFSIRRHRAVHLSRGDPQWQPRRWIPYGTAVTLTASLLPVVFIQIVIWLVLGHLE